MIVTVDQVAVGTRTGARRATRRMVADEAVGPDSAPKSERLGVKQVDGVVDAIREDLCADVVFDETDVESAGRGGRSDRLVERHAW